MKKIILNNPLAGLLLTSFAVNIQKLNAILPLSLKGNTSAILYRIITPRSIPAYINTDFPLNNKKASSTIQLSK